MENKLITELEIFVDLIWDEVWQELIRNYPQIIKEPDNLTNYKEAYKAALNKFIQTEPKETDLVLTFKEFCEDGVRYVDVVGYNDEHPDGCSMKGMSWGEWLRLEIAPETFENFSFSEIVAHCLYEMTWFGSSEEEVQDFCADLEGKLPQTTNCNEFNFNQSLFA